MSDLVNIHCAYEHAQDKMALLPYYYKWIYKKFASEIAGTVVELGSGIGHLIPFYANRAKEIIAVDNNETVLRNLAIRNQGLVIKPIKCNLSGDWSELRGIKADTVIAIDILEHMKYDSEFLISAKNLLKPHGKLLIKVPAISSLYGEIDISSGHYRRYDKKTLNKVITKNGFELISLDYMNPIGAFIYKYKRHNKTNFSRTFSNNFLRFINLAMIITPLFDLVYKRKGLSLVAICRSVI